MNASVDTGVKYDHRFNLRIALQQCPGYGIGMSASR